MNEDIEKLKSKLKKILENYEIDKKLGQLSIDSIYHMFPIESQVLLNYLERLESNRNTLKKWLEEEIKEIDLYIGDLDIYNTWDYDTINDMSCKSNAYKEVLNKIQELGGNND